MANNTGKAGVARILPVAEPREGDDRHRTADRAIAQNWTIAAACTTAIEEALLDSIAERIGAVVVSAATVHDIMSLSYDARGIVIGSAASDQVASDLQAAAQRLHILRIRRNGDRRHARELLETGAHDVLLGREDGEPDVAELAVRLEVFVHNACFRHARFASGEYVRAARSSPAALLPVDRFDGARFRGRSVDLTKTQLFLLKYLLRHPNVVRSHAQIVLDVLGVRRDCPRILAEYHVNALRKRLSPADPDATPIRTVRGIGYRYDPRWIPPDARPKRLRPR